MDANELERATAELREWAKSPMRWVSDVPYALKRVADAYLAENDPTPLTADFIRRHTTELDDGWREFEMEIQVRLAEPFRDTEWRAGWERIPACLIPETVGELRGICRKCGFELKERT
jgi:hypothetical protein